MISYPTGREVGWFNRFLDQCCIRGLACHTLRGYAFDLTHFVRWLADRHSTDEVTEQALTSSSRLDYMRHQADQQPRPAASTINTRVWAAEPLGSQGRDRTATIGKWRNQTIGDSTVLSVG